MNANKKSLESFSEFSDVWKQTLGKITGGNTIAEIDPTGSVIAVNQSTRDGECTDSYSYSTLDATGGSTCHLEVCVMEC